MKFLFLIVFFLYAKLHASALSCRHHYGTFSSSKINREENILFSRENNFDVVIIGGGSAGLGSALDASTRGLRTVVVEANDFAGETSSKSTKLLHGGVRYLEQLWKKLISTGKIDKTLLNLIKDALQERKTIISNAPHLAKPMALMTPIYSTIEIPYYWAGLKMYDLLAGSKGKLPGSHFISAKEIKEKYPHIKTEGLKGGVVYYDGQFNDSRLALGLASTTQSKGGTLLNYTKVVSFQKVNEKITGAVVEDQLTGNRWLIKGKVFVNATGPFADKIRTLDDPEVKPMISGASGTHLVIDKKFSIPEMGILIPKTSDGRVLFILPWEGHTLIGTTDNKAEVVSKPKTSEEDIDYILSEVSKYFATPIIRENVKSYWTGIRPLVSDPEASDTSQLARDHVVNVNKSSGLITITGGKWTTYRVMGEHTINKAVELLNLPKNQYQSQTENLKISGADGYNNNYTQFLVNKFSLDSDIAAHLATTFGSRSEFLLQTYSDKLERIDPHHPFIMAEVHYAITYEAARKITDVISRRLRFSMLDLNASLQSLEKIADVMAKELDWTEQKRLDEIALARQELQ
ncbi:MAG: FAD-dependent oxidoreductase [Bdellovibrionaceae bacterium]|nr:FAD-dependent oxidoreductase [Pseudobdellovibrionaceae bacterium]